MSGREENRWLLEKLAKLYTFPDWRFLPEVRNTVGISEVVRYADALAISLKPHEPWTCLRFEIKRTPQDWKREKENPAKSAAHTPYVTSSYLVVPAPRKNVIWDLDDLPDGWGLIELGTGSVDSSGNYLGNVVVVAREVPPLDFLRATWRAQTRAEEKDAIGDVPLVRIADRRFAHGKLRLECGHVVDGQPKRRDMKWPCAPCGNGAPPPADVARAAMAEASIKDLVMLRDFANAELERRAESQVIEESA